MSHEIRVPRVHIGQLGNLLDATVVAWFKQDHDEVHRDDRLVELKTNLAKMDLYAEYDGILTIHKQAGNMVKADDIIGEIVEAGQ